MIYESLANLAGELHEIIVPHKLTLMQNWTYVFLILSLIAGLLGFSSLAGGIGVIGQILSLVFLTLLIVSTVSRFSNGKKL